MSGPMAIGMSIGVVGVGLLGGSLLRALRARDPQAHLVAVERDDSTRAMVEAAAIASLVRPSPDASLRRCDVVVLCAPIAAIEAMLGPVSAEMRDGAVLSDVGGVKGSVYAAARAEVRAGVRFVGAHPMFGGVEGGFPHAIDARWRGGKVVVCTDGDDLEAIERVAELHRSLGAEVILCTAREHDRAAAAVSHLPYVVASALSLVAEGADPLARAIAGRGFDEASRLAAFAFEVQGEVCRRNPHLRLATERLIEQLRRLSDALEQPAEVARAPFDRARAASAGKR